MKPAITNGVDDINQLTRYVIISPNVVTELVLVCSDAQNVE